MEDSKDEILNRVDKKTEAMIYSLGNEYLDVKQKAKVEYIFQLPIGILHYTLIFCSMYLEYNFWISFIVSSFIGSIAFIAARLLSGHALWPAGILFGGNLHTVVCLIFAGIGVWHGEYIVAAYLALASFGLTMFVEAPAILWSLTSRKMNPRYGIAKRMFDIEFPFE